MEAMSAVHQGRLLDRHYLAPDLLVARIETPRDFSYRAGQYVSLLLPEGNATVEKPFSIFSSPLQRDHMELLIQLKPGKAATAFFEKTNPGEAISWKGPFGNLVMQQELGPAHFIGAGMGVAPLRGICKDLLEQGIAEPIRLSHLREPGSWGVFDEELADWHRACKNFSYSLIHTRVEQAQSPGWDWRHLPLGIPEQDERVFLCGSKGFVRALLQELQRRGFKKSQIVIET